MTRASADAVRAHLLGERRDWVERTLRSADAVAESWGGDVVTDRDRVVDPFRGALDRADVLDEAPAVLAACVDAAGGRLPTRPVAAPPYVIVTSEGPVLRATTDRGRLVVTVTAFEVARNPTRYRRRAGGPEDAVEVAWR